MSNHLRVLVISVFGLLLFCHCGSKKKDDVSYKLSTALAQKLQQKGLSQAKAERLANAGKNNVKQASRKARLFLPNRTLQEEMADEIEAEAEFLAGVTTAIMDGSVTDVVTSTERQTAAAAITEVIGETSAGVGADLNHEQQSDLAGEGLGASMLIAGVVMDSSVLASQADDLAKAYFNGLVTGYEGHTYSASDATSFMPDMMESSAESLAAVIPTGSVDDVFGGMIQGMAAGAVAHSVDTATMFTMMSQGIGMAAPKMGADTSSELGQLTTLCIDYVYEAMPTVMTAEMKTAFANTMNTTLTGMGTTGWDSTAQTTMTNFNPATQTATMTVMPPNTYISGMAYYGNNYPTDHGDFTVGVTVNFQQGKSGDVYIYFRRPGDATDLSEKKFTDYSPNTTTYNIVTLVTEAAAAASIPSNNAIEVGFRVKDAGGVMLAQTSYPMMVMVK